MQLNSVGQSNHVVPAEVGHCATGRYSEDKPFWSQVKECTLMTAKECPKRVLHISLDVSDSGMTFLPGDAAGVCPGNDPGQVDALLAHLKFDGAQCAPSPPACKFVAMLLCLVCCLCMYHPSRTLVLA
jgi:sulfite reductase (NADPH) flavoprotein alpha-component